MRSFLKAVTKYTLVLSMFVFLLLGCFGFSHTTMQTGLNGQMSSGNCFMPGMATTLCQMDPLEHMAAWQNMFTVLPHHSDLILLLLALFALALGVFQQNSYGRSDPPLTTVLQSQFLYYKRRIPVIHPLQEAFSSGILHPKLF